jgi:tRNA(fMet)-specific endonuclease VapC
MILLDTDTFTLLGERNAKVRERLAAATDVVAIAIVTRTEALQGRLAYLMRAAGGADVLRAQQWLQRTEADLARLPIVPFDDAAAAELDRLLGTKGMKKIGHADLLIASIALANRATLATRNLKDFRLVPGLPLENWAD